MSKRFVGIDVGAETLKLVELVREGTALRRGRSHLVEHHKEPAVALHEILAAWEWDGVSGAAVCGRMARLVALPSVPTKQAQAAGFRHVHGTDAATVVSIGSHGFSVLELRDSGLEVFRENSRCSQGTGNFLRQLVERFDLDIEEASALCENVGDPAPLSGRCPVILKTDMTHLANKGEDRARILAGLYDAVCENVQVLIKPRLTPPRVALVGGVSRSKRVRETFAKFLERHEMQLLDAPESETLYLEALGAAVIAASAPSPVPPLSRLIAPPVRAHLDRVPSLSSYLPQVHRMIARPLPDATVGNRELVLGFDIGSTGSKAVAIDRTTRETIWEGYTNTNGDPVGAARHLMRHFADGPASRHPVLAVGATGSGREIVGSLLSTCYGVGRVFVLNEIAAHAEGALHYDDRVDTIFEIGGQDAKYIRLAGGKVVDAAMNEACSAGTGSFIEEQGSKFSGIENVVQLGESALVASSGVSLGQHCSVFMAEIIDEAVAAGVENASIIAGIYDSIIQNYLNRVKGARSVGDVIFCQGMPFSSDALASAVARQTGASVIVPPNPGTVGALGIALLAVKHIVADDQPALDPSALLGASVLKKDTFVCKSAKGCGGAGNRCRIDRIATLVQGEKQRFTWGGACSVWDHGTGKQKMPDLAPDPFRERQALSDELVTRLSVPRGGKRVALTDEFQIKGLLPFFATFIHELGLDLVVRTRADHATLKRGIEEANVPFCAPMQLYHGLVSAMAEDKPDFIFAPMLREIPKVRDEAHSTVCPIVQASPDILRMDLGEDVRDRLVSPVVDCGDGDLDSLPFLESCRRIATSFGFHGVEWWRAFQLARAEQLSFDERCLEIGDAALSFCADHGVIPVVVLGRSYTIYNAVLSSNVPTLLREQGAMAVPVDCYRVAEDVPILDGVYWGYGQRNLRAAHQIRRTPGLYSLWCSNYSCGPDSFNLHFYAYAMEGRPFAVIETDGHSGDAGTKTRIEAFLHCVREDLSAQERVARVNDLDAVDRHPHGLGEIRRRNETVIVPHMGRGAETVAACLRGIGISAECLPLPTREALHLGRRHTSGKECIPLTLTLGSLLERLEPERDNDKRFAFFMPTANGPCRFGAYNMLHRLVLERLGWSDRVHIWSPVDSDYFEGLPQGFSALVMTGFAAHDTLLEALYDTRPVETRPGAAQAVYERWFVELGRLLESAGRGDLSLPAALLQVANGRLFGAADLLRRAAMEFAAVKTRREMPTVMMVGEIYVRCDPFANDFIVDKLEERGIRVRFAPFGEWLEYSDFSSLEKGEKSGFGAQLSSLVQRRIQTRSYQIAADLLGWPPRTSVKQSLEAAAPYIRGELCGEAVLTLGGPIHEWREGLIDGAVSVGPLECMPSKIAEAQFFHVAEREGLLSLTLPVNGDPVDPAVLDSFAFEVRSRFRARQRARTGASATHHVASSDQPADS